MAGMDNESDLNYAQADMNLHSPSTYLRASNEKQNRNKILNVNEGTETVETLESINDLFWQFGSLNLIQICIIQFLKS